MKNENFTLLDDKVPVYSTMNSTSEVITVLNTGDEITRKQYTKKNEKIWVSVILSDGKRGFMEVHHKGTISRRVILAQESVDVLEAPTRASKVIATYYQNSKFKIIGSIKQGDEIWIKTQNDSGQMGFVPDGVKIRGIIKIPPEQIWPKRIGYIGAAVTVLLVNVLSPSHETNPIVAAKNGFEIGAIAGAGGGFAANLIAHLFFRIFR